MRRFEKVKEKIAKELKALYPDCAAELIVGKMDTGTLHVPICPNCDTWWVHNLIYCTNCGTKNKKIKVSKLDDRIHKKNIKVILEATLYKYANIDISTEEVAALNDRVFIESPLKLLDCLTCQTIEFLMDSKFDLVVCGQCNCNYRPCIVYNKDKSMAEVHLKCPKCGANDRIKTCVVQAADRIPLVVSN